MKTIVNWAGCLSANCGKVQAPYGVSACAFPQFAESGRGGDNRCVESTESMARYFDRW